MQADISPHRLLTQQPQGPDIKMAPMVGMGGTVPAQLPPLAQQRIPTALQQMIQAEAKANGKRSPGLVTRGRR
jgi:hypothetical protein